MAASAAGDRSDREREGGREGRVCADFVSGHALPERKKGMRRRTGTLGTFRREQVRLGSLAWLPPHYTNLKNIWDRDSQKISLISHPVEKSFAAFLWLARCQFFADCNKRTAFLAANGILATASMKPLIFPSEDQTRFMNRLSEFYETGDASSMMRLFTEYRQNENSSHEADFETSAIFAPEPK